MGMGTGSASQISSAGIMGNREIRVIPSGAPRDVAKPARCGKAEVALLHHRVRVIEGMWQARRP